MKSLEKKNIYLGFFISVIVLLLCYNVINADEKIKIYADKISVDDINEEVIAIGEAIAINEDDVKIKSDILIYEKKNKLLEANGNIISKDTFLLDAFLNCSTKSPIKRIDAIIIKVMKKEYKNFFNI